MITYRLLRTSMCHPNACVFYNYDTPDINVAHSLWAAYTECYCGTNHNTKCGCVFDVIEVENAPSTATRIVDNIIPLPLSPPILDWSKDNYFMYNTGAQSWIQTNTAADANSAVAAAPITWDGDLASNTTTMAGDTNTNTRIAVGPIYTFTNKKV